MRRIRISNPLVDKTYKTYLSTDYASGTTLEVLSTTSFTASDLLVIGEPSEEYCESKQLSSVTDIDTLALASALNFDHPKGTAVYKVVWDFVSIESRSSSAGTFAEISQSPIQWDNKNNETVYYDSSGTNDYEYRFRFYSSVTATYAEYSPTITGAGFTRSQVGYMLRNVRMTVNDLERKIVSDDEIIRYFNMAGEIIYAHNPKYWFLLVDSYKQSDGIACSAGTSVYSMSQYEDLGHLDRVRYRYINGASQLLYDLKASPPLEFDSQVEDLTATGDDYASEYKLLPADSSSDQGYIQIYPETLTTGIGTLYPVYYKNVTSLDTVEDETPVPIPSLLENFAICQIEKVKGNETKAKIYEKAFYGTSPERVGKYTDSPPEGLALLDAQDHARKYPQGQPRQLWKFRGQNGAGRYFRSNAASSDSDKENYF